MPNSIRDIRDTEENKASIISAPTQPMVSLWRQGGGTGGERKEKEADSRRRNSKLRSLNLVINPKRQIKQEKRLGKIKCAILN